jgi:hypothetical protein
MHPIAAFRRGFALREGMIAMTHPNLRLWDKAFMDKTKVADAARSQIEVLDSIAWLGKNEKTGLAIVEAIEPEAELSALAEHVDLAEKAFHDAFARRNEAQIAYLREPSIVTR